MEKETQQKTEEDFLERLRLEPFDKKGIEEALNSKIAPERIRAHIERGLQDRSSAYDFHAQNARVDYAGLMRRGLSSLHPVVQEAEEKWEKYQRLERSCMSAQSILERGDIRKYSESLPES